MMGVPGAPAPGIGPWTRYTTALVTFSNKLVQFVKIQIAIRQTSRVDNLRVFFTENKHNF